MLANIALKCANFKTKTANIALKFANIKTMFANITLKFANIKTKTAGFCSAFVNFEKKICSLSVLMAGALGALRANVAQKRRKYFGFCGY
jgi:hypothetical protein